MDGDGNEPHFETDAARGGSSPGIVRWILIVSLFAAIALLSIIWITGAATQGDQEDEVSVDALAGDPAGTSAEDTDSIVDEGFDELDAADSGGEESTRTVENEAADEGAPAEPAAD